MGSLEISFIISLAISASCAFTYVYYHYRRGGGKTSSSYVWIPIIVSALTFSSTIAGSVVVLIGWGPLTGSFQPSSDIAGVFESIVTYVVLAIVMLPCVSAFALKEVTSKLSTVECPKCKEQITVSRFCPKCGYEFQTKCTNGHKVNIDDKYCRKCGVKLSSSV